MHRSELIAALEKATANDARLMFEAFCAVNPEPSGAAWAAWSKKRARFAKMLDAEAYESAALTLVPEGCYADVCFDPRDPSCGIYQRDFWKNGDTEQHSHVEGVATPALAICIAGLKAHLPLIDGKPVSSRAELHDTLSDGEWHRLKYPHIQVVRGDGVLWPSMKYPKGDSDD